MQAMGEQKSLKGGGHRHGASVPVGRDASLTEIAAINRFPEIPVGRGDDSDGPRGSLLSASLPEGPTLGLVSRKPDLARERSEREALRCEEGHTESCLNREPATAARQADLR